MNAKVDSREPKMLRAVAKQEYGYEQDTIEQGDFYLPEKDVVVERKEGSDFASSTTEGRLSKQADRMIAEHEHAYLILEGSPYNLKYSNVADNSLLGMQTSLAVKRGIKIIYTDDMEGTLYAVNRLFERHLNDENQETGYVKTHDTGEIDDVQVAMLMQIDGISQEKAELILEFIPSLEHLVLERDMYDEDGEVVTMLEYLQLIPGIGEVTARRVINAFQDDRSL